MKHPPRMLGLFVITALLLVTGCGGLPDASVKQAEGVPQRIETSRKGATEEEQKYNSLTKKSEFDFYRPYAEREKWKEYFPNAKSELDRAQKIFDTEIKSILDRNEQEEVQKLATQLSRIGHMLVEINQLVKKPGTRMAFLLDAKKTAPELVKSSEMQMSTIDGLMLDLQSFVTTAKNDYPKKAEDIDGRFAPLHKVQTEARERMEEVRRELKVHEAGKVADYAKLGDGAAVVTTNTENLIADDKTLRNKVNELYQSYSKVLIDMRVDYYVQVGRTSWNEGSDWDTQKNHEYNPQKGDERTWTYLSGLPEEQVLATFGHYLFSGKSTDPKIDKQMWNSLKINPEEGWPSRSHDRAEFWFNDLSVKRNHKYTLVTKDKKEETDWIEVDEEDFDDYADALGMEIVSKPYGVYEEDKLEKAAPPGMAYVGNPKYGRWEDDGRGGRRWSWLETYAFYHLMFGGNRHYYRYNDWNGWNRDYRGRRGYYGSDPSKPRYGSAGSVTQTSPRFRGSSFGRTGGFQRAAASVRGAGPSGRGRGPGGGGK